MAWSHNHITLAYLWMLWMLRLDGCLADNREETCRGGVCIQNGEWCGIDGERTLCCCTTKQRSFGVLVESTPFITQAVVVQHLPMAFRGIYLSHCPSL